MTEALKIIERNEKERTAYIKIFRKIHEKYKSFGKITGSFILKAENEEEKNVFGIFDSNVYSTGKAKIKSSDVKRNFENILKNTSFIELIENVLKEKFTTNKEEKTHKAEIKQTFFQEIYNELSEGSGRKFLNEMLKNQIKGYNAVIRKYNESIKNNSLDNFKDELLKTLKALNELPVYERKQENIAVFAAEKTKNPHFFDRNRFPGNLLEDGLEFISGKEKNSVWDVNELYYSGGIVRDEISNNTAIFNITGFDEKGREIMALKEFTLWNQPLQISVSNLMEVWKLKCAGNCVVAVENPAVFIKIIKEFKDISAVCTSGQLNLSAYMIFDKIENLEKIYYAGDFDCGGLIIAEKLKEKYKNKVEFMCYDKDHYLKIKSEKIINLKEINKLESIKSEELMEIKYMLESEKKAGYQELLINDYLKYIRNKIRKEV